MAAVRGLAGQGLAPSVEALPVLEQLALDGANAGQEPVEIGEVRPLVVAGFRDGGVVAAEALAMRGIAQEMVEMEKPFLNGMQHLVQGCNGR